MEPTFIEGVSAHARLQHEGPEVCGLIILRAQFVLLNINYYCSVSACIRSTGEEISAHPSPDLLVTQSNLQGDGQLVN